MHVTWNNPKEQPKEDSHVLFKTKVHHTIRIRYGLFRDGLFLEQDAGGQFFEASQIFGWIPFEDSNKVTEIAE